MTMRRNSTTGLALAAAALLVALPATGSAQGEEHQLRGDVVAVYNLAGEVTVEASSGSSVDVTVIPRGPDAGRLTVATGPIGDRETLRVIYPADAIRHGDRDWGSTQLRVREDGTFGDGSRGRRVKISGKEGDLEASADLRIAVPRGQTLQVYQAVGMVSVSNVNGDLLLDTHSASVTTAGTVGELSIDVGSGTITVRDAEGDVVLDTGSGNVRATEVRGDELLIDTGSGNVTASSVAVRDLNIDTGSGSVEVTGSTARTVLVDTGSGSVDVALSGNPDEVTIDTGSGSVTVTVPESFGAEVDIETSSGDIDIEFPLQVLGWERNHVGGTIGNGQARLTIDTGSGSVALKKQG
jgi:hypothetical protein